MSSTQVAEVLFAASAVVAAIGAFRKDIFEKVDKLGAAVALAAAGFFTLVQNFFK